MRNIKNPNHPKKGSTIKVEPISELRDVKSIKKLLADNPRDLCLFTLGINTNLRASDLLFYSQRGTVLIVPSVNRLVKSWCRAINLPGNYGSHTLRKTFGYHQRVQLNTGVPELMVMFNHASQRQTLDYLCIQAYEIRDAYMKLEL